MIEHLLAQRSLSVNGSNEDHKVCVDRRHGLQIILQLLRRTKYYSSSPRLQAVLCVRFTVISLPFTGASTTKTTSTADRCDGSVSHEHTQSSIMCESLSSRCTSPVDLLMLP